jgi:DNA-binding PadR family transcriptional regulator
MRLNDITELFVLTILAKRNRSFGNEIYNELMKHWSEPIDRTQIYRTLRVLQKKKYVARHKQTKPGGAKDNKFSLSITNKGKKKLEETLKALDEVKANHPVLAQAS